MVEVSVCYAVAVCGWVVILIDLVVASVDESCVCGSRVDLTVACDGNGTLVDNWAIVDVSAVVAWLGTD